MKLKPNFIFSRTFQLGLKRHLQLDYAPLNMMKKIGDGFMNTMI